MPRNRPSRRPALNALFLRLLESRFGPLPRAVERRGASITDPDRLLALAEQAAEARSLSELRWRG